MPITQTEIMNNYVTESITHTYTQPLDGILQINLFQTKVSKKSQIPSNIVGAMFYKLQLSVASIKNKINLNVSTISKTKLH